MGCSESRTGKIDDKNKESEKQQVSDNSLDLKYYINTEGSLNIHNFHSENLIRTLQRYSYSKEITEKNLAKAFKVMGIKLEGALEFYKLFKLETMYSREAVMHDAQKICTLFILLGKSQNIDKPSLIFKNYDHSGKGILNQENINTMIQDLLWIILYAIPIFTLQQYPKNLVLIKQSESFRKARPELLTDFKSKLIHKSQKDLPFKEFLKKASRADFMKIFNPFDLRKYALKRQNFIITPKDLKKFNIQITEESTGNTESETNKCVKFEDDKKNSRKGSFESTGKVKKHKKILKN
ncbi:hypothetical protein SteCoe_26328 [Stentor coeruleus]|uniref:Uncharacterized protein n=1 Tax=Stentor coeruleus TaxID=5963 RepID=A0A1R2BD47_9CILI|nr:hypothetical protein SteCoe_26328 [Stentor coeruleus]